MIKVLKFLVSLIVLILIAFVVLYFLPTATKEKVLTTIAGVVPETLKDKAEELILTPPERRARVLRELGDRFTRLKTSPSREQTAQLIQESEELLNELEDTNNDASLQSVVTQRIAEQLLHELRPTPTPAVCTN